jgi:ectoine hydroxylase-related dioxygenase (phytanoyl-CoA dioxygenase family)
LLTEKLAELGERGFCVLAARIDGARLEACCAALWPVLRRYLEEKGHEPNRGPGRHFLPMPFEPPCFLPELFFDEAVLAIARGLMDDQVVADQYGCDVPMRGSTYQGLHVDYRRPLFPEAPELLLPVYMLVVSVGLIDIAQENGPIAIAPGTHRMPREAALRAVESGEIRPELVPLGLGDVLLRHPWALHQGTPNRIEIPRPLVSLRYVRRWYTDQSRETCAIPRAVWRALTEEQQALLRFPVGE